MKKISRIIMVLALTMIFVGISHSGVTKADSLEGVFSFLIGNKPIESGGIIEYSSTNGESSPITIKLQYSEGLPSGTKFTWGVSNESIVKIKEQDNAGNVTLDIISPGFSGLSVDIETGGNIYTAAAYCSVYVPLQWSDNVESNPDKKILNNLLGTENNGYYGLIYAQDGDSSSEADKNQYTLQMYTVSSADHPEASHYIRKLKYARYSYKTDDPATEVDETTLESVYSDIDPQKLGSFTAALEWTSSNPSVAEVDSLTGMVTAKTAGFTTISVRTLTKNEKTGEGETLSYDVVVVPEAYISGYNEESHCTSSPDPYVKWEDSTIVFQTNALFADNLQWRVFRGDIASSKTEITDEIKADIQPSDANGRMVLKNLKAGVYYVTAVPIKGSETATSTPAYDVTKKKDLMALEYVIVVPVKFPSGDVTLCYYNSSIYDTYDLLENSNFPEGLFKFAVVSGGENVISVDSTTGVIGAVGEGSAKVSITLKDLTFFDELFGSYATKPEIIGIDKTAGTDKKINVTVYDGIAISTTSATMTLGSEFKLSLTAPSPYQGDISWTSADESICTVDENGLVKALKVGDTTITVKIVVGSGVTKRAQCSIKVVASVSSITLSAVSDHIGIDESLTITADISPVVQGTSLKWTSSDTSVAAITTTSDLSIIIKGIKGGTTIITAVNPDNGVIGTMMIHVISNITSITLSDHEVTLPKSAGFYQLYAKCEPELPENEKLIWKSSDEKVIKVDQNGKVSIVKPGTADINVLTSNGKMDSCKFTILQGMESITLDEKSLTMFVGDTYRMAYTIKPDNVSDKTLKWSSTDAKVVTVDSTGFFTAKNTGTCVITAQAQDGSGIFATCTVTVLRNATGITMDVKELTLGVGETYLLEVELKPADSTDTVKFESNNTKVATVSATGKVTAKAKGTCVIFARTDAGISVSCNVTVTQQVTGITVSPASASVNAGETLQLTASITPKNATDQEVKWTSTDTKVATVDSKGLVKAQKGGFAIIKCVSEDGDYMSYSLITVVEKVTTITVNESVEIGVGKKLKLTAVVSGETATNKNVKWASSNKKVVKVSKKGVILGVKAGTARIRVKATDGSGVYADCEVKVITATENIDLSANYVDLLQGEHVKIKATTTPKKVTYPLVWTSDNEKVAVVNKKGKITAIKAGDCIIKCAAKDNPNVYELCYVHVTAPVSISSITLAESSIIMVPGESSSVQYSISPANYTESFGWSSDNPVVATVNSNGRITAKSVGTATITVMSKSGKKSTISVYVVGLSKTKITLHQYESTKINLQLDGVGTNKLDVRWDTDNQSIADISNGKVTGRACGTTTVYCIVNGRALACTVKVIKN
ncbi:MAG: Ig-like domain-containing protein [Lachnospiraceae bacterium]|nr:Ig-like domain-containing protein [Lachnospiraceae bacterium]